MTTEIMVIKWNTHCQAVLMVFKNILLINIKLILVYVIFPEGIKLIPKGLYPDYCPSFSPRNSSGGRISKVSFISYVLKEVESSALFFGFFLDFGGFLWILADSCGFWRIPADFYGLLRFWDYLSL